MAQKFGGLTYKHKGKDGDEAHITVGGVKALIKEINDMGKELNRIVEVVGELETALATIKELRPLLEYTRLKMDEEKAEALVKHLRGGDKSGSVLGDASK